MAETTSFSSSSPNDAYFGKGSSRTNLEKIISVNDVDEDDDGTLEKGSHHSHDESENAPVQIGADESKAVDFVRIFLTLVLLCVAAAVSSTVFMYSRGKEEEEFGSQFRVNADKVIDDIMATTARSLRAIEGFAVQITIHAIDHHQTWPNVVLTSFEQRARISIDLAEAISLIFIPIVNETTREGWEKFSVKNQEWLSAGLAVQKKIDDVDEHESIDKLLKMYGDDKALKVPGSLFQLTGTGTMPEVDNPPDTIYAPFWQFAPAFPVSSMVNLNLFSIPSRAEEIRAVMKTEKTIIGKAFDYEAEKNNANTGRGAVLNLFLNRGWSTSSDYTGGPVSDLYSPIFNNFDPENRELVGLLTSYVYWQVYFENILPENVNGVIAVLENSCDQAFTFELNGPKVRFVGTGDLHETKYDSYGVSTGFGGVFLQDASDAQNAQCLVNIHMYPSSVMEAQFLTNIPTLFTVVLVSTFLFTSMIFLWYQCLVDRRQRVVMKAALQSTAVVQSLFPANVRDRLFEENEQRLAQNSKYILPKTLGNYVPKPRSSSISSKKSNSKSGGIDKLEIAENKNNTAVMTSETIFGSKPIADLFANTTIMFADMVGFTAWASVREPTQVFTLLETIYHSFDTIAKKMRVFKVETIGDCYVAVAGLPTPRKDHAIAMAKFAMHCRAKMEELSRELETSLGPDTADLGLRIGLHSGPVTAGVLRGDKGRFQLFGDTMNTASRMESTGMNGKIHLSRDTADLLVDAGKAHWITARKGKVVAKGKGEMETFWLAIHRGSESSGQPQSDEDSISPGIGKVDEDDITVNTADQKRPSLSPTLAKGGEDGKTLRLVQWNVDVLARLLKQIVSRRSPHAGKRKHADKLRVQTKPGETVLDEVIDIIALPKFDSETFSRQLDFGSIQLPAAVTGQLAQFVTEIARMYVHNPFHSFEHASHVTMSVTKLLSRIVNPAEVKANPDQKLAAVLHDHTFGITSDPLTQFACVFAALIHDLDHPGVSNDVLVKEKRAEAIKYKNKSVAEQKSVDMAWDLLMSPKYDDLRCCIYEDMDELKRFRQLVVNVVMATDIMDIDLGALRKKRWDKAFRVGACDTIQEDVNRKATIVMEHLIQASDVAHTMQHWHVYHKWNERLFCEMYRAYLAGHLDKNPVDFWYKGEIGFFDFYIIPLAKKLETCGVFGVSSDEFLNYALENRREWEGKGDAIVKGYVERYNEDM